MILHVAADAVGAAWLDGSRAAMAGFLVGLLATFLFVRINTRLIRAKVSWWFHDIESEGGTHVHHMVIGVVLMVTVGILLIAMAPSGLAAQVLALLFGAGVALTLDEFALILNLQDVYWRKEGRLSVDAVIIVVTRGGAAGARDRPVRRPREIPGLSGDLFRVAIAWFVAVSIVPVPVLPAQGQELDGVIGVFIPLVGDRRRDQARARSTRRGRASATGRSPKKLARAERREARLDARWLAWRDAFFDLIAGKPHLPSLPPLGPDEGAVAPDAAPEQRPPR